MNLEVNNSLNFQNKWNLATKLTQDDKFPLEILKKSFHEVLRQLEKNYLTKIPEALKEIAWVKMTYQKEEALRFLYIKEYATKILGPLNDLEINALTIQSKTDNRIPYDCFAPFIYDQLCRYHGQIKETLTHQSYLMVHERITSIFLEIKQEKIFKQIVE